MEEEIQCSELDFVDEYVLNVQVEGMQCEEVWNFLYEFLYVRIGELPIIREV